MKLINKRGKIEIWAIQERHGIDFYVYGVTQNGDPRICPSLGMAYEVAAI
jgi:hypothetical protein